MVQSSAPRPAFVPLRALNLRATRTDARGTKTETMMRRAMEFEEENIVVFWALNVVIHSFVHSLYEGLLKPGMVCLHT